MGTGAVLPQVLHVKVDNTAGLSSLSMFCSRWLARFHQSSYGVLDASHDAA
jgi:hypothetical protein